MNIHKGKRGDEFKKFITTLVERGNIKDKFLNVVVSEDNFNIFEDAFTSKMADSNNNYEVYEQLGDVSINKFIVWYMYDRFPQLFCSEAVKIVARLRINYASNQSFSRIAENLGFFPYITSLKDERGDGTKKKRVKTKEDLLEDVFEAFFGATEYILDKEFRPGVGYAIIRDILKSIFDQMDISLKYSDLYDAKTRLKELFDFFTSTKLGVLEYKENVSENGITTSNVYRKVKGQPIFLGKGSSRSKIEAQQNAAKVALDFLNKQGYTKQIPDIYHFFCD